MAHFLALNKYKEEQYKHYYSSMPCCEREQEFYILIDVKNRLVFFSKEKNISQVLDTVRIGYNEKIKDIKGPDTKGARLAILLAYKALKENEFPNKMWHHLS